MRLIWWILWFQAISLFVMLRCLNWWDFKWCRDLNMFKLHNNNCTLKRQQKSAAYVNLSILIRAIRLSRLQKVFDGFLFYFSNDILTQIHYLLVLMKIQWRMRPLSLTSISKFRLHWTRQYIHSRACMLQTTFEHSCYTRVHQNWGAVQIPNRVSA